MLSRKQRPPNAPGPNGLRGGQNAYPSGKTALGGWIEDQGGPGGFKRGFSSEEFITECQHQQMGASLKPPALYGAAIANRTRVEKGPRTSTEVFNPETGPQSKEWITCTHLQMKEIQNPYDEKIPRGNLKDKDLEAYRSSWTSDNDIGRTLRFQTDAMRFQKSAVPPKFQISQVRMLPGTPIALERLRGRLLERHGILAMSALRYFLGKVTITQRQFQSKLKELGLELGGEFGIKLSEISQMVAYFTTSVDFHPDAVMRAILGVSGGFESSLPSSKFLQFFPSDIATVDEVKAKIKTDAYPDFADGLALYLDAYGNSENCISECDFIRLHQDLYASSPEMYNSSSANIWL